MVALEICFCKRAPRFERKRQHATAAHPPRYGEDRRELDGLLNDGVLPGFGPHSFERTIKRSQLGVKNEETRSWRII
ncbi:hypothetical protein NPIL_24031 [Nephila pilipes]|uniref:Uncharacterized protein n=1 Tax=Nephila pilipes TaxID=299642 RepID=A0A8X6Q1Y9_NEPPI|nr:hypothetical protein NPIL_24031 [Nephila pilipes]